MPGLIIWTVIAILFVVGLIGVIVPVLPGVGLIFAGIVVYAVATDFSEIGVVSLIIFGAISLLTWLMSYAGAAYGAKVGGGSRLTVAATLIGALVGLMVLGPIGLFVGAFVGAVVMALWQRRSQEQAFKIALSSVVGIVGATVVQFIVGLSMIAAFFLMVLT